MSAISGNTSVNFFSAQASAVSMLSKIKAALAEDASCRKPGIQAGLYEIESLQPFSRFDGGIPMICNDGAPAFQRAASNEEFRQRLSVTAPFLESFDLKAHGFCLAGGSVSAMLMHSAEDIRSSRYTPTPLLHDFDLFLVGHRSDSEALAAIRSLQVHLVQAWGDGARVYRTQGCISFYSEQFFEDAPMEQHLVQVILRRYSTAGEVIHGFDLGSSAALWDGERVLTTALGKLAFEHGANVLHLEVRRNSYERRIKRYFDRGFDIVLPDLNPWALLELEGRLPYLQAWGLRDGGKGRLTARALQALQPDQEAWECRSTSITELDAPPDSSNYERGEIPYGLPLALLRRNVRALNGPTVWTASLCADAPLSKELDVSSIEPTLDPRLLAKTLDQAFGSNLNIKRLLCLLGQSRAITLVHKVLMANGAPPPAQEILDSCVHRCAELKPSARIPFAFMTVEDKTALTGPFPRSVLGPGDWYGLAKQI